LERLVALFTELPQSNYSQQSCQQSPPTAPKTKASAHTSTKHQHLHGTPPTTNHTFTPTPAATHESATPKKQPADEPARPAVE
jgi:hypothetical protein